MSDQGKQGVAGDQGAQGVTGDQGEKGTTGERGVTGKRGESGDQGGKGASGERGNTGERGPQGDRGQDGKALSVGQTLALFGFIVLAFVVLAYRTEVSDHAVRRANMQQAQNFAQFKRSFILECNARVTYDQNASTFRRTVAQQDAQFREQERTNKFIDAKLRAARVESWTKLINASLRSVKNPVLNSCEQFR